MLLLPTLSMCAPLASAFSLSMYVSTSSRLQNFAPPDADGNVHYFAHPSNPAIHLRWQPAYCKLSRRQGNHTTASVYTDLDRGRLQKHAVSLFAVACIVTMPTFILCRVPMTFDRRLWLEIGSMPILTYILVKLCGVYDIAANVNAVLNGFHAPLADVSSK